MPQPRKHKTNADRQKAYRARQRAKAARADREALLNGDRAPTGAEALITRVLAADDAMRARES